MHELARRNLNWSKRGGRTPRDCWINRDIEDEGSVMATGIVLKVEAILARKGDCRTSFDSDMHNALPMNERFEISPGQNEVSYEPKMRSRGIHKLLRRVACVVIGVLHLLSQTMNLVSPKVRRHQSCAP